MSNIETSFLKRLLETQDMVTVVDKQIVDRYFHGKNRKAFKFIREHTTKYGKVPDRKTFDRSFPNFGFMEEVPQEHMAWYADELRNKTKHNTIVDTLESIEEDIENLDPDAAYAKIKQAVMKIENEVVVSDRREVNKDTQRRREAYEKRAKSKGMTGVPYGMDRLDYVTKGANKGELTTLLAYTSTGKTWFEVLCAVSQAKAGYRVLLMTTEMSADMMQRRVDAAWALLSYTRFRDGRLTKEEDMRFDEYLKEMQDNEDFCLIVEQATGGVSQVAAKIDQHQPDMVYIDGAYLLTDEESEEDDWKSLVHIWRGLHRICLTKSVPIFVSTQSKERKISLAAISFAKAIAADCDVIIGLEQDDQQKEDREAKITFHKIREGALAGGIVVSWDFDKMEEAGKSIYMEGHDVLADVIDEEQVQARREAKAQVKAAGKARFKVPGKPKKVIKKPQRPSGVQSVDDDDEEDVG